MTLAQAWVLSLFYSAFTPEDIRHTLVSNLETYLASRPVTLSVKEMKEKVSPDWVLPLPCNLALDATYDSLLGIVLRDQANQLNLPILTLNPGMDNVHIYTRDLAEALQALFKQFGWSSVSLITEPGGSSVELAFVIRSGNTLVSLYELPSDASFNMTAGLVAKELKVWSSPVIVCAAAPQTCSDLLQAALQSNMMKAGYAYVFIHPPGLIEAPAVPGLLHVLEKGSETAQSLSEYHALRVAYWVGRLMESEAALPLSLNPDADLRSCKVWNWLGNSLQLLTAQAIFPGNTTTIPIVRRPIIDLSIDWDLTNPTKAPNTPYGDYFLAASLAYDDISKYLPTHDLIWNNLTYGCTEFVESYVKKHVESNRNKLGVATMAAIGSGVAMGTNKLLSKMNISLPMIGSANSHVLLANSTEYPYYVRTIVSSGYGATVYMTMFRYFGWKRVNVLYGNESYGIDFYHNVKSIAEIYGIEIANREDLRAIDPFVTNATIGDYNEHLKEVISNNVRPLLIGMLLPTPVYIFQGLYDMGARAGDIIYFGDITPNLFDLLPPENTTKAIEIGLGGIQLTSATYITPTGKAAFHAFKERFGHNPLSNSCFYYDSAFALADTLKFLIHKGINYEDHRIFMQALRQTKFRGCSGVVAFESGSNDRSFPGYVVINLQGSQGNLSLIQSGYYNPTSVQLFSFDQPIIWPGGGTITPSNLVESTLNCPFKDRHFQDFGKGQTLASVTCAVIALLISLLSVGIYLKFWRQATPPLTQKQLISVDDVLLMASVVLEAFQYAALGPDYQSINQFIFDLGQAFSVSLNNLVTFSKGVYWICLNGTLAVCAVWVLLIIYVFLRLDEMLKNVPCIGNLGWIAWLSLPYLGNLCFLPIVSILLDVFVCNHAVGINPAALTFSDTILSRDCYVRCWQDSHIYYVIFAIIGLFIYAPLAVLLRPLWQEFQVQLHIKTAPSHHLVKTIFQMLIIGLSKALKQANSLAHGLLFIGLLTGFFLFEFHKNRFNYGRIAHWHRISLAAVLWLSSLALLSNYVPLKAGYWLLITVLGWVVLVCFGFVWMLLHYPSLLVRPKGIDTQRLFRFAFQFRDNEDTRKTVEMLNHRRKESTFSTDQLGKTKITERGNEGAGQLDVTVVPEK